MGGTVTRALKNFNVESRAHRVIGREKPAAAPPHPGSGAELRANHPDVQASIYKKDDNFLSLLKEVYVDSTDPPPIQVKTGSVANKLQGEHRRTKMTLKQNPFSILHVENIPKGKLSIVEALIALSNHKHHPDTWTAEKIADEYSLELKDTKSLLEFFVPFDVKIIPPTDAKQIKPT